MIATDAFGNALGSSLAGTINSNDAAARINADQMRSGAEDAAADRWAFNNNQPTEIAQATTVGSFGGMYAAMVGNNVVDFRSVAETKGSYPSKGLTDYLGSTVPYTTSYNSNTGMWEQYSDKDFIINSIGHSPQDWQSGGAVTQAQLNAIVAAGQDPDAIGPDFQIPGSGQSQRSLIDVAQDAKNMIDGVFSADGWKSTYRAANNFFARASLGGAAHITPLTPEESSAASNTIRSLVALIGKETEPMMLFGLPGSTPQRIGIRSLEGAEATFRANFVGPTIGRSGMLSTQELSNTVFNRYQQFTDMAYQEVLGAEASGILRIRDGVPRNTVIGQRTDRISQSYLNTWMQAEQIPDGLIDINRYLRDPAGTGAYRIPDVRVPSAGQIFDGTIGYKWSSTPQIVDFSKFSGGNRITIVRPTAEGGSYSIPR